MDNLTPRKIEQLLNLAAEDTTWNNHGRRLLYDKEDLDRIAAAAIKKGSTTPYCESSSGVYDLDQLPGFDEPALMSTSILSNNFNTIEISGRSTEADTPEQQALMVQIQQDFMTLEQQTYRMQEQASSRLPEKQCLKMAEQQTFKIPEQHAPAKIQQQQFLKVPQVEAFVLPEGPHNGVPKRNSLLAKIDNQSGALIDFSRHSIPVDMSFHSHRDLTADEISLIERTTGIKPAGPDISFTVQDFNASTASKEMSMGAYFQSRCVDLSKMLPHTQSGDKSYMKPSISEVSGHAVLNQAYNHIIDDTLDSIPVRQIQLEPETQSDSSQVFKVPKQPARENRKSQGKKSTLSKLPVCTKPGSSTYQNQRGVTNQASSTEQSRGTVTTQASTTNLTGTVANQASSTNLTRGTVAKQVLSTSQKHGIVANQASSTNRNNGAVTNQAASKNVSRENVANEVSSTNQNHSNVTNQASLTNHKKEILLSKQGSSTNGMSNLAPRKPVDLTKPLHQQLKNLRKNLSPRKINEDSDDENSLSISKIADFIGKQSDNLNVSEILKINKKCSARNRPLSALDMNVQEIPVSVLEDALKSEAASLAGAVETVLRNQVPQKTITKSSGEVNVNDERSSKGTTRSKSKSPSTRSQSTVTTVKENNLSAKSTTRSKSKSPSTRSQSTATTVKKNNLSAESTTRSKSKSPSTRSQSTATTVKENNLSANSPLQTIQNVGDINRSKIPSPNREYRELDKSVDWQEVLQTRDSIPVARDKWAAIDAPTLHGYVGVTCEVPIKITTLNGSWLTAMFYFDELPNKGKDINVEVPRSPLMVEPDKPEIIKISITFNIEMNATIPFTVVLKDSQEVKDVQQKENLKVKIKYPIIQAMSSACLNTVLFPPILEKRSYIKCFILLSDCPVDLQLELQITEGESFFNIRSVQEIKKNEANKALTEPPSEEALAKSKPTNKQLCRMTTGNAIKVGVIFNAPAFGSVPTEQNKVIKGKLSVSLFVTKAVLRQVEMTGVVGFTELVLHTSEEVVQVTGTASINVTNAGSLAGIWRVKIDDSLPIKTQTEAFELAPGSSQPISLYFNGPAEVSSEGTIVFEEIATGKKTKLLVRGQKTVNRPKNSQFPIKSNYITMSWVCAGTKEISLLNCTNSKVQIRCEIIGEAFRFETAKSASESKMAMVLNFGPHERRNLPIIFSPKSKMPYAAVLKMTDVKDGEFRRKINLFGCDSADYLRWWGLATYGNTALVRAVIHSPIDLNLYNKCSSPAFVYAKLNFNLHYLTVSSGSQVVGGRAIIPGRSKHNITIHVDWAKVERRSRNAPPTASLATLTLLTGTEITRQRILRIIKDERTHRPDKSLLPENLQGLTKNFEGEDASITSLLDGFEESLTCLQDVIDGLEELTAQIDLPQDFADDNNTIVIADETVVNYHTLCE